MAYPNASQVQLGAPQATNIQNYDYNHKIDEVRKNMELPEALRFRSNTGTKAEGFEQTFDKA